MLMRDVEQFNTIVEEIANQHELLHGLIVAAGIQHETAALEYWAEDADYMMSVNVTGCLLHDGEGGGEADGGFGNGGSTAMIASMSWAIANRVCLCSLRFSHFIPGQFILRQARLIRMFSLLRDSLALPTTPPKPPSSNSVGTSHPIRRVEYGIRVNFISLWSNTSSGASHRCDDGTFDSDTHSKPGFAGESDTETIQPFKFRSIHRPFGWPAEAEGMQAL